MFPEEIALAQLEAGRVEAEKTEAARQARYASEDAARVAARAEDARLVAEGAAHRDAMKAQFQAALADRLNTPEKQAADKIAELTAQIAHIEALVAPAPVAPVAPAA